MRATCRPRVCSARNPEAAEPAGTERGERVRVLTERDITRAVAEGADTRHTPLAEYMSLELHLTWPDDESHQVASHMLELGVRHLPVTENGKVIGMISMRDLLLLEALTPAEAPTA